MDNRCVVFYDSGRGGEVLFKRTKEAFPNENYVYFADEKNMPYGEKTQRELEKIFYETFWKILSFAPKLVVVACNTMSCVMINKAINLPVKTVWVTPVTDDGVKTDGKTLLLTTSATAKTRYVKKLIENRGDITLLPQERLASEVEKWLKGCEKPDLNENFKDCPKNFDFVSLGCTHYSHLKKDIQKIFPESKIISGEEIAYQKIEKILTTSDIACDGGHCLYVKT